ncbi:hypothetical protein [Desulfosporosinus meridiei]|uniref:Spo0E like sporulation regulatory protein n=1 Tax=Desulfosporosinus meridiei (strain ATCC BAA-275 / DSM 13257 / KCTC 12902 / NCIMB 13706 / S10) TaxID=768704 RepID=J7IUH7_DESMD|nr:hypothetical protein [Desulfosporosinus meridiei]AFQ43794.1 hypothetical protein Desmer_1832 [Desulfosporosinus meridiei DSM 13257]
MGKISLDERLKREKEKLHRLVEEAINNGIPIIQDEAVMRQNRKVDVLVVRLQKELGQHMRKE